MPHFAAGVVLCTCLLGRWERERAIAGSGGERKRERQGAGAARAAGVVFYTWAGGREIVARMLPIVLDMLATLASR